MDFIVNEIDLEGNVIHLTDMDTLPDEDLQRASELEKNDPTVLKQVVGEDQIQKFVEWVNQKDADPDSIFQFEVILSFVD